MKIAIIGCGTSGKAAAMLADKYSYGKKLFDDREQPDASPDPAELVEWSPDIIVLSPGIPESSKLLKAARSMHNSEIISELEFAFRHCKIPVIAITGTNGKTTTTELTTHLFQSLGHKAFACGNIGVPLSEALTAYPEADLFVAEVSSFQLDGCTSFAPDSAALLNISSDHIDRYGSLEKYAESKFRLFKNMKYDNVKVLNSSLLDSYHVDDKEYILSFSATDPAADFHMRGDVLLFKDDKVIDLETTSLRGPHNAENLMAAAALISAVDGIDVLFGKGFADAVKSFNTGAHRQEIIAEKNGIKYVNDSKATNPHAVIAAIDRFAHGRNICIILGGLDKDMDFSLLLEKKDNIKYAAVIGRCSDEITKTLSGAFPMEHFDLFEDAVKTVCAKASPGDVVMLSPACASMDMFKNYAERGDAFRKIVSDTI